MSNLQAEAASLAARINSLGLQEEALSERYDAARYQLTTLQNAVTAAQAQLATAQASTAKAKAALKADALQAYADGGNSPLVSGGAVQGATNGMLRSEYINTLATNQSDAVDQYHLATLQEKAAASRLKQQEAAARMHSRLGHYLATFPQTMDIPRALRHFVAAEAASLCHAECGLVLGTAGNVSARSAALVAVTPTGATLAQLTAEEIVYSENVVIRDAMSSLVRPS